MAKQIEQLASDKPNLGDLYRTLFEESAVTAIRGSRIIVDRQRKAENQHEKSAGTTKSCH